MKKTFIKQALALSLLCSVGLVAREIRSPLPIPMTATAHYPLMYCCHYKQMSCHGKPKCDTEEIRTMHFELSGAGYTRNAEQAFGDCGWTHKVPFSTLLFGKADFKVAEAFPGATVGQDLPTNPFVAVSTISTRYEYDERGAVLGACLGHTMCDKWHTGVRARLPIRDIDVHQIAGGNDLIGETVDDLFTIRQEPHPDGVSPDITQAYAVRLDFLNALAQTPAIGLTPANMIVKWDLTPLSNDIQIANINASAPLALNSPSLAAIGSTSGVIPVASQWADLASTATALVAADGSGVGNGLRGRFQPVVYGGGLAVNPTAQSQLYVVPTLDTVSGQITGGAVTALSQIQAAVDALTVDSVKEFLDEKGLNFWNGHTQGIGDLDLDLFLGRNFGCCENFFAEVQAGLRVPTAKKVCNCLNVLKQSTGNNGHLEARVGTMLGWDACKTVKIRLDGSYNYVAKKTENIAAPFVGATVKNIGPCINADIKWHYFTADANISFFASQHCGFDVSYQFYGKGHDKICPCITATTDFIGRENQNIDTHVASRLTKVYSHKARAEFFMSTKCCELFVGGAYTFAGRNAMRDVDCFLGMQVRF